MQLAGEQTLADCANVLFLDVVIKHISLHSDTPLFGYQLINCDVEQATQSLWLHFLHVLEQDKNNT